MQANIVGNPDFGSLQVTLDPGEEIWAESGAMSRMSGQMRVKPKVLGSLPGALLRRMVAGESVMVGRYQGEQTGDFVSFSPGLPGTVMQHTLNGPNDRFFMTAGAFLACTPGIKLKLKFGGLRSFFSSEGVVMLVARGAGTVWYNGYGACVEKQLDGVQPLVVDTGHVVAWEPTLDYKIKGSGGLKATLFSGEGLTMHFHGAGKIVVQTRTPPGLASWLPFRM